MKSSDKIINIIRWATRILGILTVLLFLIFFIGEGFSDISAITIGEWVMMFFVPVVLLAGIIVAWRREMLGGIIVILSILLFNLTSMIAERAFTFQLDFGFFLIIGFGFVFCGFVEGRLNK